MSLRHLLIAFSGAIALLASVEAFAHAQLKSQAPAADSLVKAPAVLSLVFSEGVEAKLTKVEITRNGSAVAVSSVATDPNSQKVLIVTPAMPFAAGDYQVNWHAVSVDTHKSEGSYHFKVQD